MIKENLDKFMQIAAANGFAVSRPEVFVSKLGQCAGRCYPDRIELDAEYMEHFPHEVAYHTLGHEFAHWIQFQYKLFTRSARGREAHNAQFKQLCRMLGVSDKTTHSMKLPSKQRLQRIALVCPACSKEFQVTKIVINRMAAGKRSYHCHCKQPLSIDNLVK
jgi:predicted SprT family Zn-dependent metalloprotease